jgi:hypothetical protein
MLTPIDGSAISIDGSVSLNERALDQVENLAGEFSILYSVYNVNVQFSVSEDTGENV